MSNNSENIEMNLFRDTLNKKFIAFSGGEERAPFMNPLDVLPFSETLDRNFALIQSEIIELLQRRKLTRYEDIDKKRAAEVSKDWKLFYVKLLNEYNELGKSLCPNIYNLTKDQDNILSISIAVLEPGVCLAAHEGPYAGILRYHLGIEVPEVNPPYIRVKDQYHTWQTGKSIVLDDVFDHEVYNNASERRVILIVDFKRPMPKFYNFLNNMYLKHMQKRSKSLINNSN
ncbi:aspartyl/asparaginyl beta-hydroxylase domain-containing protein [Winslowiella iniecta]|uniref:aspartyl/asparaginyl beta-hydroxylase domain-containing protein n=1 Tax=Winslowiella iniecta TaxID=1560201 RepID=UPI0009E4C4D4|nr:aspartyl/asparaginyl beta-hydroxylase domain-containing protein [Winslowiella iniecta]